jgi:hypothetical protein
MNVKELPNNFPKIICLCGSGRFKADFEIAEFEFTRRGKIVLTIGCNTKDIARDIDWSHLKPMLDDLHKRKIDLADEVFVINKDGYIGESTKSEIEYATKLKKPIFYLEPIFACASNSCEAMAMD